MHRNLQRLAERPEQELGEEKAMFLEGIVNLNAKNGKLTVRDSPCSGR